MNSLLLQIFWSQSSLFQWVHTVRTDSVRMDFRFQTSCLFPTLQTMLDRTD